MKTISDTSSIRKVLSTMNSRVLGQYSKTIFGGIAFPRTSSVATTLTCFKRSKSRRNEYSESFFLVVVEEQLLMLFMKSIAIKHINLRFLSFKTADSPSIFFVYLDSDCLRKRGRWAVAVAIPFVLVHGRMLAFALSSHFSEPRKVVIGVASWSCHDFQRASTD